LKPTKSVVVHPAAILREKCSAIEALNGRVAKLALGMRHVLSGTHGIGLAAPQVGVPARMILVKCPGVGDDRGGLVMINPVIVSASPLLTALDEGCLSLPGVRRSVSRPAAVEVSFLTEDGERACMRLADLAAKVVQHEIDHLDGVLILDY
jgi:peptide deformylase